MSVTGLAPVLAVLALAPLAHAAADDSLTLTAADVPGLKAAGTGSKVAATALGVKLPKALKQTQVRGAAFSGAKGESLRVGVYVTSGPSRARTALKQVRGKGFKKLSRTGDEAWRRTTVAKKSTTSTIVLRQGAAVGVVRSTIAGRQPALAPNAAQAYAAALAQRLDRVLQRTAFERVLDGIADDGSITPRLALNAFAIAYGPLPGVKRPAGPAGGPPSATEAMMLVARVWDRLTPAQQRAVDEALGAPHDATSPPVARAAAPKLTPNPGYQVVANKYVAIYAGALPGTPPVDARVFTTTVELPDAKGTKAYADALPVNAAGKWGEGAPAYCRVRIPPFGQAKAKTPEFEFIVAHEVFHCFEFAILTNWNDRTDWIMEGLADWAAATVYPAPVKVGVDAYKAYLLTPGKALFSRSYDALGFWGRADESGGAGSLWGKIPAILGQANEALEAQLAGVGQSGFDDVWASATRRLGDVGAAWQQNRPYAISAATTGTPTKPLFGNGGLTAKAYALGEYTAFRNPSRPLVHVEASSGSLRAGASGNDYGALSTRWFCLGAKCECPPEQESSIPDHEQVPGTKLELALTGGATAGKGKVSYHTLKEFCKKSKSKSAPSGPAESNGDPHLTSFDGLHFDFQAAGEFLLAKSRSGDLQIQGRQEPYESSKTVSVNTQIAARIGGRRVTVSPGAKPTDVPVVRIDGVVDQLPGGSSEPLGDGTISRDSSSGGYVTLTWSDGSTLVVRPVGRWGVAMVVQLAGERAGDVTGLLGDFDADPSDDLADRKGKRIKYTAKASTGWEGLRRFRVAEEFDSTFFDALYDTVGDAWRISQAESLFDYGPGQSTKTFTDKKVPAKPVDPAEIRRALRAKAEQICRARGVNQPGPLEDCITDVAATGNAAFADDAFVAQEAASVVWNRLAGGSQITGAISLATSADGVLHVGFNRGVPGGTARSMGSVPINAAGGEGPEETIGADDGDVTLFTASDGTTHALAAEIPASAPSGVYQYGRAGDGSWAGLGLVTGYGSSYADAPAAQPLPDGNLLTVSPMAGVARVFRGQAGAGEGTPVPVADGCYGSSPAIARDSVTGIVYVAWYQWNCPQEGVFVVQVDTATGGFVGQPAQAPGSVWTGTSGTESPNINLDERLAMTGRPGQPGVYLAYETGPKGNVALWRVGAPTATTFARKSDPARHVRIAADPSGGRLWVVWDEPQRFWIQRTTPEGTADGAARPAAKAPNPSDDVLRLADLEVAARGGSLDLVMAYQRGDTPGALYRARITP
jgi:von Willebrand factor type D domain